MSAPKNKVEKVFTGLEIDESIDLHIRAWQVQPFAWVFIGLFVISGALGLFGTGWLSKTELTQGKTNIQFEKYFRIGAVMKLVVIDGDKLPYTVLSFSPDYLSQFNVDSVTPEPESVDIANGMVNYRFKGSEGSSKISFFLLPEETGNIPVHLKVNNTSFHFSHFIFP